MKEIDFSDCENNPNYKYPYTFSYIEEIFFEGQFIQFERTVYEDCVKAEFLDKFCVKLR